MADFGASLSQTAQNTGTDALKFDPTASANTVRTGFNSLAGSQLGTTSNFQNAFAGQIAGQPSATDYYKSGMDYFNVAPLQNTANSLNNAVLQDPQMNVDRAKGFDFGAGQVQQQTTQDLARLSPLAIAAQNNAQTAQGNAMNYANMGMQQSQLNTLPYTTAAPMIQNVLASQASGYNTAAQQELEGLISKMNAGITLSATEMNRANQLAQMETSYNQAIATANIGNEYKTLSPAQTLVNTMSGGNPYRAV